MEPQMELSVEQQFSLRAFESQVQKMSHEQAQSFLTEMYRNMIIREEMYKHFLKHQWGLNSWDK